MSRGTVGVVLSVALGFAILAIGLSRGNASAPQKPAPQTWEYKIITVNAVDPRHQQGAIDKLGAEGWELVALNHGDRLAYWVFKRPK